MGPICTFSFVPGARVLHKCFPAVKEELFLIATFPSTQGKCGEGKGGGGSFRALLAFCVHRCCLGEGGGGTGEACHELEDRKREREACRGGWM